MTASASAQAIGPKNGFTQQSAENEQQRGDNDEYHDQSMIPVHHPSRFGITVSSEDGESSGGEVGEGGISGIRRESADCASKPMAVEASASNREYACWSCSDSHIERVGFCASWFVFA
jgi:hypothetical protein